MGQRVGAFPFDITLWEKKKYVTHLCFCLVLTFHGFQGLYALSSARAPCLHLFVNDWNFWLDRIYSDTSANEDNSFRNHIR